MKNINPSKTAIWKRLQQHFISMKDKHMRDLFILDPQRFSKFSVIFDNTILLDYSKNIITTETLHLLRILAKECNLSDAIASMFHGDIINFTENRSVLHIALRNRSNNIITVNGNNIMPEVNAVLEKIKSFCFQVISGTWKGYTGKPITDVVNIGIGGSDIGPYMVTEALRPYKNHLNMHFVSNIDGTHIVETIKSLDPATTLFLIASKTFTTEETITNAYSARNWFLKTAIHQKYITQHFIALSKNINAVTEFGISTNNIFQIWDWVGGRYSLWSAMGISIALSLGFENFEKLLMGAYAMDNHFMQTKLEYNLPVILALIGIWYNNFFSFETEAVLPYDQYMYRFATYLQQGNMESNGKSIDRNGHIINYQTGPIIWGGPGTNGQHAFYQLLHQGTKIVPCDFIAPVKSHNALADHHSKLLSHFFAQTEALAFGKSYQILEEEYQTKGKNLEEMQHIIPFQVCYGNRPSNSILLQKITPYSLGALISLYEHKIFTQGVILNIYSFDQWGVELGKRIANTIHSQLKEDHQVTCYNSSTNGLINCYKSWR